MGTTTTAKAWPSKKDCTCKEHMHECKDGKHEWLVTRWRTIATHREALEMSCKFCLKRVDITKMNNCEVAESNKKA